MDPHWQGEMAVMSSFESDLWNWLLQRSPKDAATPDVQRRPDRDVTDTARPSGMQPIETNVETMSVLGLPLKTGSMDKVYHAADGELARIRNDTVLLLACEHFGAFNPRPDQKENKVKKISGRCFHCWQKLQEQRLDSLPVDRLVMEVGLTLVCDECERRTTDGHLCCPDHSEEVESDGKTSYLGPEDSKEKERRDTVNAILGPIVSLFSSDNLENPLQKSQEQNHA